MECSLDTAVENSGRSEVLVGVWIGSAVTKDNGGLFLFDKYTGGFSVGGVVVVAVVVVTVEVTVVVTGVVMTAVGVVGTAGEALGKGGASSYV